MHSKIHAFVNTFKQQNIDIWCIYQRIIMNVFRVNEMLLKMRYEIVHISHVLLCEFVVSHKLYRKTANMSLWHENKCLKYHSLEMLCMAK